MTGNATTATQPTGTRAGTPSAPAPAATPGHPAGPDPARGRLRVLFQLRVPAEQQPRFLAAYQRIRHQVAQTPGHLADQLCQSTTDPAEWMIISEWETAEHFHAWERTPGHRELAAPLVACATRRRSLRYLVRHQTVGAGETAGGER